MKDNNLDILLKSALSSSFVPDHELDLRIIQKAGEIELIGSRNTKKIPALVIVFSILLFCCVTAFAAWRFLSPKDIALEYGDKELSEAFKSKDAIFLDESQTYGDYTITLLGCVTGSDISNFAAQGYNIKSDKTYAVVAISRTDRTPMPDISSAEYAETSFFVSPLVQGLNPMKHNIVTMNGGYSEIINNGIMYRMIECDNVEIFSDRKIYICVTNTVFYDNNAYIFNESTGEIAVNSEYKGMNLLFDLPLDKQKADKEAADEYLRKRDNSLFNNETDIIDEAAPQEESSTEVTEPIDIVKEILDNWTLICEKRITPDEEGKVYYSFKKKNGHMTTGVIVVNAVFPDGATGYSKDVWYTGGDELVNAYLTYKDKNGDIIVSMYE